MQWILNFSHQVAGNLAIFGNKQINFQGLEMGMLVNKLCALVWLPVFIPASSWFHFEMYKIIIPLVPLFCSSNASEKFRIHCTNQRSLAEMRKCKPKNFGDSKNISFCAFLSHTTLYKGGKLPNLLPVKDEPFCELLACKVNFLNSAKCPFPGLKTFATGQKWYLPPLDPF